MSSGNTAHRPSLTEGLCLCLLGLGRGRWWHLGLPIEGTGPILYIERNGNLMATPQNFMPVERQLLPGWPKPHCGTAFTCPGHPKPHPWAVRAGRSSHWAFQT